MTNKKEKELVLKRLLRNNGIIMDGFVPWDDNIYISLETAHSGERKSLIIPKCHCCARVEDALEQLLVALFIEDRSE